MTYSPGPTAFTSMILLRRDFGFTARAIYTMPPLAKVMARNLAGGAIGGAATHNAQKLNFRHHHQIFAFASRTSRRVDFSNEAGR